MKRVYWKAEKKTGTINNTIEVNPMLESAEPGGKQWKRVVKERQETVTEDGKNHNQERKLEELAVEGSKPSNEDADRNSKKQKGVECGTSYIHSLKAAGLEERACC